MTTCEISGIDFNSKTELTKEMRRLTIEKYLERLHQELEEYFKDARWHAEKWKIAEKKALETKEAIVAIELLLNEEV